MIIESLINPAEVVGKLTIKTLQRRKYVAIRRLSLVASVLCAALLPGSANGQAQTPDWQPTADITATAEAYLRDNAKVFAGNTTVSAGTLDTRHRLAYCSEPLQGFLRNGTEIKIRTIVGVRCSGTKPWKIYVPVDVIVTASVLVARQTLVRGHVLVATDLSIESRDVSRVRRGYLSDTRQVVGQRLKTQVIAGKMLTPSMLEVDLLVRRNQTVTLTVGGGHFRIRMAGTTLMDGAIDQRIRVQNNHSGRIVEGIVRSREHVEVLLPNTAGIRQLNNPQIFHAKPKVSPRVADIRFSNNER